MYIDELLDQLSLASSQDNFSLKDLSCDGSTSNQSQTSSSDTSWLSESSCGGLRSSLNGSTSLVFHKQRILPPIISLQHRSEIQNFKKRAVEIETKLRRKSKDVLIDKVESIIINSNKTSEPDPIEPPNMETTTESPKIQSPTTSLTGTYSKNKISISTSKHSSPGKDSNDEDAVVSASDDEEEDTIHCDMYKKSLQKLLQKSMTYDLNDTFEGNSSMHSSLRWSDSSRLNTIKPNISSSSDHNAALNDEATSKEADDPVAVSEDVPTITPTACSSPPTRDSTPVQQRRDLDSSTPIPKGDTSPEDSALPDQDIISNVPSSPLADRKTTTATVKKAWMSESEIEAAEVAVADACRQLAAEKEENPAVVPANETLSSESFTSEVAEGMVSSVLDAVVSESVTMKETEVELPAEVEPSHENDDVPPPAATIDSRKFATLVDDSTDNSELLELASNPPNSASEKINEALRLIEKKLNFVEGGSAAGSNSTASTTDGTTSSTNCELHADIAADENEVRPNAEEVNNAVEKEPSSSNDDHDATFDETSLLLQPSNFMSLKSMDVDFSKLDASLNDSVEELLAGLNKDDIKQTSSRSHSRKSSYSLETPSPFLVNSKETHTIQSELKTDSDPGFLRGEVKRKLDMAGNNGRLESKLSNMNLQEYYKKLQKQHESEMIKLQMAHKFQLEKIKTVDSEMMHLRWCKLSALVKGHLTRQLLWSKPSEIIMKTVRDTSRTILSIKSDETSETSKFSAQDNTLLERLFSQLRAALYDFHDLFFTKSKMEQMEIVRHSHIVVQKENFTKQEKIRPKLSAATLKSMERKKMEKLKKQPAPISSENPTKSRSSSRKHSPKMPSKQVQSKISHIWKSDSVRKKSTSVDQINIKSQQHHNNHHHHHHAINGRPTHKRRTSNPLSSRSSLVNGH